MLLFLFTRTSIETGTIRRANSVFQYESTLTQKLAQHFQTLAMPEYALTLLEWREGKLDEQDLPDIARGQVASEDGLALYANRILITDTDAVAT